MILFSTILLTVNFTYLYFYKNILSYFGVYFITLFFLILNTQLIFWTLYDLWIYNYFYEYNVFNWAEFGNKIIVNITFKEDFFNNLLALVMIFGSVIVTSFSFFEMRNDKEGSNFIIILGYFMIFMLILIGSTNLIMFYLGWEGISLVSYLLVSFWSERVRSIKATFKIFIISKVGDFFLLVFICLVIKYFSTVDFDSINALYILIINHNSLVFSISITELLGILLVLGTCVKSAQFGFHIWLLEAMEAPLGASALMHSSTLVIAGVVLLFKMSYVIELSTYAQFLMYIMGIFSALMGSFLACFQFELKVILAYSTISNMGYIFTLFSLQKYNELVIILLFHAFIKIYMFLVIGSIIYVNNGNQDIRWMGCLMVYYPFIWISYLFGSICLIGLPYFTGYFYKTYLINSVLNSNKFLLGGELFIVFSYFFTFFYLFRLGYVVFFGNKNGHHSIYKVKYISSYYIFFMILLSFIIMFSQVFWVNLIFMNKINYSVFSSSYQNITFLLNDLTYLTSYLWIIIYFFIFFFIIFLGLINLNHEWLFFKNWNLILNVFLIIIIYYIMLYVWTQKFL